MEFEEAYAELFDMHVTKRKGEGARRLQEGHGYAEKMFLENVWWPAFQHFHDLYPEYEVSDFKDGTRYLDFAYLRSGVRLAIEIDGYGPHLKNISRWQFSDQCRRQNDLVMDGWQVLRFTLDDVKESPRYCQQVLHQFMGRWFGDHRQLAEADWVEREVIRLFLREGKAISPADVCRYMGVERKTARKWLLSLAAKNWIEPASGSERIRSYRLVVDGKHLKL